MFRARGGWLCGEKWSFLVWIFQRPRGREGILVALVVMVMELVVRDFGLVGLSSGDGTSLAFVSEACSECMPLWCQDMQTLLT